MGMDLVPVYEGDEGGRTGSILIDPVTVQNMGIKTTTVQRKDMKKTIRAVGTVTYDEEKLYTVNSKISGWIEKLYVNFTGQAVKKGEPLLDIYSPDLVSAQEEYLLAIKNKNMLNESAFDDIKTGAQSLLVSTRKRLENWDIPARAIDQLEQRSTITKTMTLIAPANGVVIHKNAVEGVRVNEGANLYQIGDLSTVWVDVSVYDYELPWVNVGQEAEMELSYLPGKKFYGTVSYIYPYLNRKARDIKVRVELHNPQLELKPDMYVNITLYADVTKNALVIPGEAVIRSGKRNLVFVPRDEGKFEPREISLGAEGESGDVIVTSGLLEGEPIVTSGQFLLDSESNAQEAIRKMLEAKQVQMGNGDMEKGRQGEGEKRNMETMTNQSDMNSSEHNKMDMSGSQLMQMDNQDMKKQPQSATHNHQHDIASMLGASATERDHGSTALYTCPMHLEFTSDDPNVRCPECGMKLKKKSDIAPGTALYTCSMHPDFVTDDPTARCPICEMKLVKKD
ncbi:efflux RND transporter periplasmic adaptor subunit [candidate division KSB1 bacterium]|nr:efflux RND transporter periplasmic adaptor subunit [candidate division KSB1 bacterium]